MTVSGSLLATVLAAGSVSIDVEPGVVCVSTPSLARRVEKAGLRVAAEATLRVHVQREGSRLEVRGRKHGRELLRTFEVRLANCASAEQLVATLVVAWAEELITPPRVVVAPPPPDPVRAPPPEEPPVQPSTAPPDEQPVIARRVIGGGDAGASASPQGPVSNAARDWFGSALRADVALLGGLNSGPTNSVAFTGQLELSARLGHFGLLVDGGLETGRFAATVVPVTSTQQWLSISALAVVSPSQRLDLQFAVGFRLWRITGVANDVIRPREAEIAAPGAVASIGASLAVWGPLRAHVRGYFGLRGRAERFALENYGTVLTLQPWQGGVLFGVDWRWL